MIFAVGSGLAWTATGLIRKYALSRSLIDIPNARSSHTTPMPRGGGLAIVLTFFVGLLYLYARGAILIEYAIALFGGGGLVALVGFFDDHKHVPARWRILIHFVAAAWALYWVGGFPTLNLAGISLNLSIFGYVLGAVFLVWLLNLYNFMDGIDGIAGIEALFVALAAGLLECSSVNTGNELPMLALLASACLGFLIWNWPPAKIFMGDVGSGFLGFVLGSLALITVHSGNLSIWSWLILLAVFWVDATFTLLRRIVRGDRWYQAHCSHAYQHASRLYRSHLKVTGSVLLVNMFWLFPLAAMTLVWPGAAVLICMLAVLPLFILAYRLNAGIVGK